MVLFLSFERDFFSQILTFVFINFRFFAKTPRNSL